MGIRIRTANPEDAFPMAKVHVDTWRSAYSGIMPTDFLSRLSYQDRERWWRDILAKEQPATSNFVALSANGGVIGLASGGPTREGDRTYQGELYVIYLLEQFQGKGVGRRLVCAVANRLLTDGIRSMLVWVLEDNFSACRFYRSLGGKRVNRKTISIGGVKLPEVSYGWNDVTNLASESPVRL